MSRVHRAAAMPFFCPNTMSMPVRSPLISHDVRTSGTLHLVIAMVKPTFLFFNSGSRRIAPATLRAAWIMSGLIASLTMSCGASRSPPWSSHLFQMVSWLTAMSTSLFGRSVPTAEDPKTSTSASACNSRRTRVSMCPIVATRSGTSLSQSDVVLSKSSICFERTENMRAQRCVP